VGQAELIIPPADELAQLFSSCCSLRAGRLELRRRASEYRRMEKFAGRLILLIGLFLPKLGHSQQPLQREVHQEPGVK